MSEQVKVKRPRVTRPTEDRIVDALVNLETMDKVAKGLAARSPRAAALMAETLTGLVSSVKIQEPRRG